MNAAAAPDQHYRLLIVGGGGREHALAWSLARDPRVSEILVAPGNVGTNWPATPGYAATSSVPLGVDDLSALAEFAHSQAIDLTIVGPEAPLVAGIVDMFQASGLTVFGPSLAASQLEGSKAFAKALMHEQQIPTADYARFSDYATARAYVLEQSSGQHHYPVVIKADGLAAGKGVAVCATTDEALAALENTMVVQAFGDAGATVIIEERLVGPEISLLAFSDGQNVLALPTARDHKRALEGDQGPNTGGMGAYAPVPDIDPQFVAEMTRSVLQPAVDGLRARGIPYVGMLYAGLILTSQGPRVLEFNCRFGDPEAQAILPLVTNLLDILLACVAGQLADVQLELLPGACATVVLASPGYPGSYLKGLPITGLAQVPADVLVFQAGTARNADGQIVTNGGRVLAVSGCGPDLTAALARAYAGIAALSFEGMHYRRDIGRVQPSTV